MAEEWKCQVCGGINPGKYEKCLGCSSPKGVKPPGRESPINTTILNAPENYKELNNRVKWEYLTLLLQLSEKEFLHNFKYLSRGELFSSLDQFGEYGWELVNVVPVQSWHTGEIGSELIVEVIAFMKRQES
jgi:hypothetical protein